MVTADRLTLAAAALRRATKDRDHFIVKMRAEGATLRAIAAAAKMTPQGVVKVLARMDARR